MLTTGEAAEVQRQKLISLLEDAWLAAYSDMCDHKKNVMEFQDHGFTFLYDQASMNSAEVDDRLVAAYGLSIETAEKRDASRIQGLLGGGIDIPGKGKFDKGHVLAHSMGGGTDVNLFPQRPELNRGISEEGKKYREMEKYAADHPGTFVFSRLIYSDKSWVPISLEYGLLMPEGRLWAERFTN
jgi:hypothetical protein